MEIKEKLDTYFEIVEDTRKKAYVTYEMKDILFLIFCGILSGCKEIEEILIFGEERIDFFRNTRK